MDMIDSQDRSETEISIFVCFWSNKVIKDSIESNILTDRGKPAFDSDSLSKRDLGKLKIRKYLINKEAIFPVKAGGESVMDKEEKFSFKEAFLFSLNDDISNKTDSILGASVIEFVFESKGKVTDKETAAYIKRFYQKQNRDFFKNFRKQVYQVLFLLGAEQLFFADSKRIKCAQYNEVCISPDEANETNSSKYLICPFFFLSSYKIPNFNSNDYNGGALVNIGTRMDNITIQKYGANVSVSYLPIGCGIYHNGVLDGDSIRIYKEMLITYFLYMNVLLHCECELDPIVAKVGKNKKMSDKEKLEMENIRSRCMGLDKISLYDFCPVYENVILNTFRDCYEYYNTGEEVNRLRKKFNNRLAIINKTLAEQTNELLCWLSILSVFSCGSAILSFFEKLKSVNIIVLTVVIFALCLVASGFFFSRFKIKKGPGILEISENEMSDYSEG